MRKRTLSTDTIHSGRKVGRDTVFNVVRNSQTSSCHRGSVETTEPAPSSTSPAAPLHSSAHGPSGDIDAFPGGVHVPVQRHAEVPAVEVSRQKCTLSAGERIQLQYLRGEVKRAQDTIQFLLKANESAVRKNDEPPPHCSPKIVKSISNSVVSHLLLEKEILYPTEDTQQEALLREFGISVTDNKKAYDEFIRAWNDCTSRPNLKTIMKDAMRRRKGSLTKNLREELYAQLSLRKYHRGATLQEKQEFNKDLQDHKLDNVWRTSEEDGVWDPWGSSAVHASISKAIYGVQYIPTETISLSLELAAFIFYVLTLAMEDRNLQGNERLTLAGELEEMTQKIVDWEPHMKRIAIKFPDAQ